MADEVLAAIGAGQAAAVLAGQAGPAAYQCLLCDGQADAARDETAVILGFYGRYAAIIDDEPPTPAMLTAGGAVNLSLGL